MPKPPEKLRAKRDAAKEAVSQKVADVQEAVAAKRESVQEAVAEKRESVQEAVAEKYESVQEAVAEKREALEEKIKDQMAGADDSAGPQEVVCFLNIIVVDKEAAIANMVGEKTAEALGDGTEMLSRLAAGAANALVSNDRVAAQMAEKLCEKMPAMMAESGITAVVTVRYKLGSFVVLELCISAVNVDRLVSAKAQEAETADKMGKLKALQSLADRVGLKGALDRKLEATILKQMQQKLTEMLPAKLESKMGQKGMVADVSAKSQEEQATHFYHLLDRLELAGSPKAKPPNSCVIQ